MKHTNYGVEFKTLRRAKGIALDSVSKRIGVAYSGLSRWENNPSHNISLATVQKALAVVGKKLTIEQL